MEVTWNTEQTIQIHSCSSSFYLGEIIEIEITSPESCGQQDTRDVVSTIVLQCDPEGRLVRYCTKQSLIHIKIKIVHATLVTTKVEWIYHHGIFLKIQLIEISRFILDSIQYNSFNLCQINQLGCTGVWEFNFFFQLILFTCFVKKVYNRTFPNFCFFLVVVVVVFYCISALLCFCLIHWHCHPWLYGFIEQNLNNFIMC